MKLIVGVIPQRKIIHTLARALIHNRVFSLSYIDFYQKVRLHFREEKCYQQNS